MSGLDLGPILNLGAGVFADAIRTMGTVGELTRPTAGPTVDPETLVTMPGAVTTIATDLAALVVPGAPGGTVRIYPGATEAPDPRWTVGLLPEVTDLRRGDLFTVTASRDARLVGGVFELGVLLDNAAGVARIAEAKRVPIGGQT